MVRESLAHIDVAISESRLSNAAQSVLPSASSAATLGSRVPNASAWATKWLAPMGDGFIASRWAISARTWLNTPLDP